MSNPVCCKP